MSLRRFYPALILFFTAALMLLAGTMALQREAEVYSLIIPGGENDSVADYLRKKGIDRIYTDKMPVVYTDFVSLKEIPLSELSGRLLDTDRRFDPYLKELVSLFETSGGSRLFFQSDKTLISLLFLLAPQRDLIRWEQAGSPYLLLLCPVLYAVLAILLLLRYRSFAYWALSVQLLWIPYLINAEGAHIVFVPLLIYWEIVFIENWGDWKSCLPYGAAALISGVVLTGEGSFLLMGGEFLLTSAAGLLLRKAYLPKSPRPAAAKRAEKTLFRNKTEHDLFVPAYFIVEPSRSFDLPLKGKHYISILILALPLIFTFDNGANRGIMLPSPGDLYDHIYYQENILYSPDWGERESLEVRSFQWDRESGKIRESREGVAQFTSSWIEDVNSRYGDGYADSLLLGLPAGTESLSVKFYTDFDKYSIFAIIALFFLSKLVISFPGVSGKEKKSLQIIKRGREVA